MGSGFFSSVRACLLLPDPHEKCTAVLSLGRAADEGRLDWDDESVVEPVQSPGRPERPELIDPARVPRRRLGTAGGRAALVHAIAHIEFNAINLAWDAIYRFRGMPEAFYTDWARVACEEAHHYRLLSERLRALGYVD